MNSEFMSFVKQAYDDACDARDKLAARYKKARRYYDGDRTIVPFVDENRSKVVMNIIRYQMRKLLRNVRRVFFGADTVVEYAARTSAEDAGVAKEITQYVNGVLLPETRAEKQLMSAFHVAGLVGLAPVEVRWRERKEIITTVHTSVSQDDVMALAQEPDVISIEVDGDEAVVRRTADNSGVMIEHVPFDEWLIDPSANDLSEAVIVGRERTVRLGEIAQMGFDVNHVREITNVADETKNDDDSPAETVTLIELFIRYDLDGDGVEEIHELVFVDDVTEKTLLEHSGAPRIPFAIIQGLTEPDQMVGEGLYDSLHELQRILTALLRQAVDNAYLSNIPRPIASADAVENVEDLSVFDLNSPIITRKGIRPDDAVSFLTVPFVAQQIMAIMPMFERMIADSTGINDVAGGLDPEVLQNMTAAAVAVIEQSGIGGIEEYTREFAIGVHDVFKLLLQELVEHPPEDRMMLISGEPVQIDPRSWHYNLTVKPNVGLGAGSRQRDMQAVNYVLAMQKHLIEAFGPDNPYVKPENLYNAVVRAIEASGLRTPDLYISKPDPEEIARKLAQPDPKLLLEQAKMQQDFALEKAKLEREQAREVAQMEADLRVREKDLENQIIIEQMRAEARKEIEREKIALQKKLKEMEEEFKLAVAEIEAQTRKEIEQMRIEAEELRTINKEAC